MFFDVQKASMLKRISAWILDAILLVIVATGFALLVSAIIGYDSKYDELTGIYERYANQYGVSIEMTEEAYSLLTVEEQAKYQACIEAMNNDSELSRVYEMVVNMSLVIVTIGMLLAFAITEFAVPLILKNGQTVGKKVFGICLMQSNQIKIQPVALAVRTFLGKYTIEAMAPILVILMIFFGTLGRTGTIVLILLLILQFCVVIFTQNNLAIHDLLAATVCVDLKSQMIFENLDAKEQYKEKLEQKTEKRDL